MKTRTENLEVFKISQSYAEEKFKEFRSEIK